MTMDLNEIQELCGADFTVWCEGMRSKSGGSFCFQEGFVIAKFQSDNGIFMRM